MKFSGVECREGGNAIEDRNCSFCAVQGVGLRVLVRSSEQRRGPSTCSLLRKSFHFCHSMPRKNVLLFIGLGGLQIQVPTTFHAIYTQEPSSGGQ